MVADQLDRASELIDRLTQRERAVLDLVIEHKTTKEIARDLDISPNTVDQRLRTAREKLGTTDRNATARAYTRLISVCGKTTYEKMVMVEGDTDDQPDLRARQEEATFVLHDAAGWNPPLPWETKFEPVALEAFGESLVAWQRIALVVGLAALAVLIVLATFAIAQSLASVNLPGFLTT